jgi:D-alanyl-D-alanine carboxypeptidase (penicillin-binding protein 5/6)
MASTTKIMTAILILESGVDLGREVKVSERAANTVEPSKWVNAGEVLTVEQLLYALMIRSANGAAVALAEADAGSVEAFVEKMNQKAAELGMDDTRFVTTNGLDADGHYSTAADMALVGRYAMKNERFRELVDTKSYSLQIQGRSKPLVLKNTNKLLQEYDWVTGIKTGLTPRAEQCLVSSGTKNGRSVIAVVLGQPDSALCFKESKALLEYGFTQFQRVTLMEEGVRVAQADVPYQADGKLELITNGVLETEVHKGDVFTTTISVDQALELPVKAGDVYGQVVVTVDGKKVGAVDVIATKSFAAPTLGTKLAYYWQRFWDRIGLG